MRAGYLERAIPIALSADCRQGLDIRSRQLLPHVHLNLTVM